MPALANTDDTAWLTGPRARKLLRLYLAWPKRFEAEPIDEARLFFSWLKDKYGDLPVVGAVRSVNDVGYFLSSNPEVIEAAKFLKPNDATNDGGSRREERIRTSTYVYAGVFDCPIEPAMIGSSVKGSVFDVTPGGLGLEASEMIPAHSILNLTVAPAGYPIVLYRLSGEVRWTKAVDDRYQIGVRILETDEVERWRADFETRFAAV